MSEPTIGMIEQEFYTLCSTGEYAAAYQLATRTADRFPAWAQSTIYNWRFCTACLMGDPALALRLIAEALDTGYWYGEADLRDDSDLAALHSIPEFERLVVLASQRRNEAVAQAKPDLKMLLPANDATPYPLLLALHGNNSNIADSERYWRSAVEHGWLVALPQSSQIMSANHYGWNDRGWAVREITQHAATVREQYPIDPTRVAVAGFSMGGGLAAKLALSGDLPARGFIGVGPFLANVGSVLPLLEAPRERPLRAYLIASQRDAYCYSVAQELAELLPAHGIACELELHLDLGHDFPPEFERSLIKGLDFIMR
ncbi:MAG: PHB depolymerase family esterase [Roseiflexaceae bacterium]